MSDFVDWPEKGMEHIAGTASQELKERVARTYDTLIVRRSGFGETILKRMRIAEVSLNFKVDEPSKKEARVVCELDVAEGRSHPD